MKRRRPTEEIALSRVMREGQRARQQELLKRAREVFAISSDPEEKLGTLETIRRFR